MAKRQKENENAEAPAPKSMWVRYIQQPGMPAGPHTFGPFATRLKPEVKITLKPAEWMQVNGEWARALQESALSTMCEFSATNPE